MAHLHSGHSRQNRPHQQPKRWTWSPPFTVLAVAATLTISCATGSTGSGDRSRISVATTSVTVAGNTQSSDSLKSADTLELFNVSTPPALPDGTDTAAAGRKTQPFSVTSVPTTTWALIVQAPFSDRAAVVFDWVDENNFAQLRYVPDRSEWVLDRLDGGTWTSAKFAVDTRPEDTTLSIRRYESKVEVEIPEGLYISASAPAPPSNTKAGIRWMQGFGTVAQFDLATIAPAVPTQLLTTSEGTATGSIQYTSTYIPGEGLRGNATLFMPPIAAGSKLPVVIVLPGVLAASSSVSWIGPALAANGVATLVAAPLERAADPKRRTIDFAWLTKHIASEPTFAARIDVRRVYLAGHSMGGGGALFRAALTPDIAGVIALAPWLHGEDEPTHINAKVPTLVMSCELDDVAPFDDHVQPILDAFGESANLTWYELGGEDHGCPTNRQQSTAIRQFMTDAILDFIDGTIRIDDRAQAPNAASRPTSSAAPVAAKRIDPCDLLDRGQLISRSSHDCD